MNQKKQAATPPLEKTATQNLFNYNPFLCKLQYLLAIPSFPFIVVCLGYVALFALFIFWRLSQ